MFTTLALHAIICTMNNTITRNDLENAGYIKDSGIWISPSSGECLSFEQARAEYAAFLTEDSGVND